jgi:cell division control protein 6
LKDDELKVLSLAAKHETCRAGELYNSFHATTGTGYTRFHEILNKLDAVRLIDTDFSGAGARGRSRIIKIRYDPEEILSRIDL